MSDRHQTPVRKDVTRGSEIVIQKRGGGEGDTSYSPRNEVLFRRMLTMGKP